VTVPVRYIISARTYMMIDPRDTIAFCLNYLPLRMWLLLSGFLSNVHTKVTLSHHAHKQCPSRCFCHDWRATKRPFPWGNGL